jgi:tryptophan synthase beta chain
MGAYDQYLAGQLEDYEYPEELVQQAMKGIPAIA